MNLRARQPREASINLTPLIDILFIVLVFLVLTTTFRESTQLRIRLPEAFTSETLRSSPPGSFRVTVAEAGQLFVAERPVSLAELRALMREIGRAPEAWTLLLSADERAEHGRVVEVMDLARRNRIFRISIETLRSAAPP